MLNVRNVAALVGLTFLLTVYLKQMPPGVADVGSVAVGRQDYGGDVGGGRVKKVVAYSLKKRIEMDGEAVRCIKKLEKVDGFGTALVQGRWSKVEGTELYIYSAHLDGRLSPYDYVRILGMSRGNWNETLFCNLVTEHGEIRVASATKTYIWSENWNDTEDSINYKPVLISCQLPIFDRVKVFLSKYPCEITKASLLISSSTNKIHLPTTYDYEVVVCVKPLNFLADISKRLVEWIEMNSILGADIIQIYVKRVHPNVKEVLQWYTLKGRVNVIKDVNFPGSKSSIWQKRKNEILTYNHCLYQYLHRTRYVLPLDIDEFIIPKKFATWQGILRSFPVGYASYSVRNTYFLRSNGNVSQVGASSRSQAYLNENTSSNSNRNDVYLKRSFSSKFYSNALNLILDRQTISNQLDVPSHHKNASIIHSGVTPSNFEAVARNRDIISNDIAKDFSLIHPQYKYSSSNFTNHKDKNLHESSPQHQNFVGRSSTSIFKNFERTIFSEVGESGKSFVSTAETLTVFNHYALHSLKPGVGKCHFLPVDVVQMNHYKETCSVELLPECKSYLSSPRIHDEIVVKYKVVFDRRYAKVKKHLNFL